MYLYWDSLTSHFDKYFSEDMDKHKRIRNTFVDNAIAPQGFTSLEAKQFINPSSDLTLKSIYSPDSLTSFSIKARFEFLLVNRKPLRISGCQIDCFDAKLAKFGLF